jgi:8-oxo-dGTP diphosphatase
VTGVAELEADAVPTPAAQPEEPEPEGPEDAAAEASVAEAGSGEVVRAAGGAVWRWGPSDIEVLLVHRPAYDDWTLPKGKVQPGEDDEDAALREVLEETGFVCELGAELHSTHYHDRHGRQKVVRYWAMEVYTEVTHFHANEEIDKLAWLGVEKAMERLTYERDQEVLDALVEATEG